MAINHNITERELLDLRNSILAIQREKGKSEEDARYTANLLTYGVFRNLLDYNSVVRTIVNNARVVFSH